MNKKYENMVGYLLDWYDKGVRILPWRENPKPYYVWISEIMLQQTRVEAVKPFFDRFIKALPEVRDLAEVEEDKLLKLWEGLGYYNRAKNLKKAAIMIMEEYNGTLPASYEHLLELPGIGSYTAGAIASIAYQIPVPAVDGNVLRVTKRITNSYDDITKQKVKSELENELKDIMPGDRPGDFNQSLMELGATVCLPNGKPLCDKCPVYSICEAREQGSYMQIPVKPAKKARKIEEKTILLIEHENNIAIRKRDEKGLLSGLWEFPNFNQKLSLSEIEELLKNNNVELDEIELLGEAKHFFSHIEWRMIGYKIKLDKRIDPDSLIKIESTELLCDNNMQFNWVSRNKIDEEYSVPTAFKAYKEKM
ncbi:A/G-specific adenine glycosylase [Anaeromicropila herbilytica]|uniref:Adenine DNA glycosylase n=1 Tax=Anaeromicropila herbilytica TaxID=2785025 RepID=A0A7R7ENG5_9FIRM|nr:A/G-specific adenine glycosylase [Anaeromicropila herbilytica]BCN32037.1 adenine DNA glycosylase [Anaeromicropila herbilytica]